MRHVKISVSRWFNFALAAVVFVAAPQPVHGQDLLLDPTTPVTSAPATDADNSSIEPAQTQSKQDLPPETATEPNYVPVVGIVGFDFLLNRAGERFVDRETYRVTTTSVRHNLRGPWVVDNDPFSTNQFLHPYQGSMYHGFARSAGHSYWTALGYSFAGSALWEIAGETTKPSINDQIASGIGGTFLGEPLFRIANLVFERSDLPPFWRELLGLIISPSTEFNRGVYGDRFRRVFSSRNALVASRMELGVMGTSTVRKDILQSLTRNEGVMEFSIDYGLPGRQSYTYEKPFDYFSFEFGASSANIFEHIFSRGLLAGKSYGEQSGSHRGVWGLYGTYDYVAPQIFRVSSVAVSLGDTSERRLPRSVALQTTVLGGIGYGAAGTIHGSDETDYHYGLTPQMLAALRFIAGDTTAVDLTVRDYYVSRVASTKQRGSENNARLEAVFTRRFVGDHAASLKYIWSRRSAAYPDLGARIQSRGSFGIFYTYLGNTRFGNASW